MVEEQDSLPRDSQLHSTTQSLAKGPSKHVTSGFVRSWRGPVDRPKANRTRAEEAAAQGCTERGGAGRGPGIHATREML